MENGSSATTTHWELLILLCFLTDSAQHIEAAEGYYGFFLGGLGDSGTDTILYSFAVGTEHLNILPFKITVLSSKQAGDHRSPLQ